MNTTKIIWREEIPNSTLQKAPYSAAARKIIDDHVEYSRGRIFGMLSQEMYQHTDQPVLIKIKEGELLKGDTPEVSIWETSISIIPFVEQGE